MTSYSKTDEGRENLQKHEATEMKTLQRKGNKFHADFKFVKTRHVNYGILSCVKTTSLRPDAYIWKNVSSDMLTLMRSPAKVKERWCERISCTIEGVYTIEVLISRENLLNVRRENLDQNTPSNSPRAPGTKLKYGKERVHREVLSKSVRLMNVVLARQNSKKDHIRRPCNKKDAPAELRGIWRKIFTISRRRTKLRFILLLKQGQCRHTLRKDQRRENS